MSLVVFLGSVWQWTRWKGKEANGGKKSKQRFTIAFFVNAAGEKIDKPLVIWKSKKPRCFKHLSDKSRPADVHYFSNPKSWMTSDVMQAVLTRFNRKLLLEQIKVVLILHNVTCHLKSIINSFSHIKIISLPKNTTLRFQPPDVGIIQNFKVKYRKRLTKYVLARINEYFSATRIIKDVNILIAIWWAQEAWKEATGMTIKNCFKKCGIIQHYDLMEIEEEELEFKALFQESHPDVSATEYVNFDANIPASEPLITEHRIDWWKKSRENCINAILNENNIAQEISDDDNDVEEVDEIEDVTLSFTELLKMLDKINKCSFLDEERHKMLSTVTKKLENL